MEPVGDALRRGCWLCVMVKLRTDNKGIDRWQTVTERGVTNDGIEALPDAQLLPRVVLRGTAVVRMPRDYLCIGPLGSRDDFITVTFKPVMQITTGCFTGTFEQFRAEVDLKEEGSLGRSEYKAVVALLEVFERTR